MSTPLPLKAPKSWTERVVLTLISIAILALLASILYSPLATSRTEPHAVQVRR
jgi:hypothetical protein